MIKRIYTEDAATWVPQYWLGTWHNYYKTKGEKIEFIDFNKAVMFNENSKPYTSVKHNIIICIMTIMSAAVILAMISLGT